MDTNTLVRMANQITDYFAIYPKSEAVDGIAKHIHSSWDPRMRNGIKTYIENGGEGLRPLFIEALSDYFKGPKGSTVKVAHRGKVSPKGAAPSFADGGGDAG